MRETKFRGKSIETGEWVYGNLIRMESPHKYGNNSNFSNCWIMEIDDLDVDCFVGKGVRVGNQLIQVDSETVGQYTGLQDNKGKDIYEKDLLLHPNENTYEVYWNRLGFAIKDTQHNYVGWGPEVMTVIGNIYEVEVESK